MGKFQTKVTKFAKDTTLHGIKEAEEAKSPIERLFWISVLLVALSVLTHELVTISLDYYSQPTMTKISLAPVTVWPTVTVCPRYWLAEAGLKQMGFSQPTYEALHYVFLDASATRLKQIKITNNNIKQFFGLDAVRNLTIDEIVGRAAYNTSDVIVEGHDQMNISRQHTANGICYRSLEIGQINPVEIEYSVFDYFLKPLYRSFSDNKSSTDCYNAFMFGNLDYQGFPIKTLLLPCTAHYSVHITARIFKTVSTRWRPCNPANFQPSERRCNFEEFNNKCKKLGKKPIYYPGLGQRIKDVSTWLDDKNHCTVDPFFLSAQNLGKMYEQWQYVCPTPCESWIYEASVVPLKFMNGGDKWQSVSMRLSKPLYSWLVVEELAYTMSSFVGTIGGQLSLWSGASIISICQICYFFGIKRSDNN